MPSNEFETKLDSMAEAWRGASVANRVSEAIDSSRRNGLAHDGLAHDGSVHDGPMHDGPVHDRPFVSVAAPETGRRVPWLEIVVAAVVVAAFFVPLRRTTKQQPAQNSQSLADAVLAFDKSIAQRDDDPTINPSELVQLPAVANGSVVDAKGQGVANAKVTVRVRRYGIAMGSGELTALGPWSTTTDDKGQYEIELRGMVLPTHHEVRIQVSKANFADMNIYDNDLFKSGSLSKVKLLAGRRIQGRVVDSDGKPVPKSIVRFFANDFSMDRLWGSGPFAVDDAGVFSISVPTDAKVVGTVYPRGFAPRFIDIGSYPSMQQSQPVAVLSDTIVQRGTSFSGRVVDRKGNGIAGTVVGFRNEESREMFGSRAPIGRAVRTMKDGHFQLPPLVGRYQLTVTDNAPDYAQQCMLVGSKPPTVQPLVIDTTQDSGAISLSE